MTVPITVAQSKQNIWVAAGEGDLEQVRNLIENESLSPNVPDIYTYTPMHAAASYGHIHVLEYLVSKGGDVNIEDNDGETPLFVVESVEVARWLVEHGADIKCINAEGNTAAQNLSEEFPEVVAYLQTLDPSLAAPPIQLTTRQPSQYTTEQAASSLTDAMMEDARAIIQRADAEGRDPEEELRGLVERAVLDGLVAGAELAQECYENGQNSSNSSAPGDYSDTKRVKY